MVFLLLARHSSSKLGYALASCVGCGGYYDLRKQTVLIGPNERSSHSTIFHRIMLHENLGQAHRKHAYQLMANELKMSHMVVSLLYMAIQLVVSLGFIYLCPNTVLAHWIYLVAAGIVLAVAYVLFMRKNYHLHEEYLAGQKKE